eukprot:7380647-Prymnesium_polylepis.2
MCGLAAKLLSPLEFARGKHAGHHGSEYVERGGVSGCEADDQPLALVAVRYALRLGDGVESVGSSIGLAEACEVVQVQQHDRVVSVKPHNLVPWRHTALCIAANAPQDLVLPPCKRLQRGCLVHGLGDPVLEDVVRPSRVSSEDIAEGAVVYDIRPGPVPLDDLSCPIQIRALALDLLQAPGLPLDDGVCAWFASLELGAVCDAVAQLASALPNKRSGLAQHPPHFSSGLDRVETSDPLPVLSSGSRADLQVGKAIVETYGTDALRCMSCISALVLCGCEPPAGHDRSRFMTHAPPWPCYSPEPEIGKSSLLIHTDCIRYALLRPCGWSNIPPEFSRVAHNPPSPTLTYIGTVSVTRPALERRALGLAQGSTSARLPHTHTHPASGTTLNPNLLSQSWHVGH